MSTTRLCKDCKYAKPAGFPFWFSRDRWRFAECRRGREVKIISPLDGKPEKTFIKSYCEVERQFEFSFTCGPGAKFFSPKRGAKVEKPKATLTVVSGEAVERGPFA